MKKVVAIFLSVVMVSLLIQGAYAITGSIGNSRMILHLAVGEKIEKYILVRNVNDVPVKINISVSGELAKNIELKDKSFSLNPDEERKAYFTIKPTQNGTTESNVNVAFTPQDGSGVGLVSTVIVIANGTSMTPTGASILKDLGISKTSLALTASTIILIVIMIILMIISKKRKKKSKPKRSVKDSE